jgi:D-aminopeptidase
MPSSELAEYLLRDYVRTHLSVRQQSEIGTLLTQWQIAVRHETDHRTNALLVQFVEKIHALDHRLDVLEANDAEQDAQITKLTHVLSSDTRADPIS